MHGGQLEEAHRETPFVGRICPARLLSVSAFAFPEPLYRHLGDLGPPGGRIPSRASNRATRNPHTPKIDIEDGFSASVTIASHDGRPPTRGKPSPDFIEGLDPPEYQ